MEVGQKIYIITEHEEEFSIIEGRMVSPGPNKSFVTLAVVPAELKEFYGNMQVTSNSSIFSSTYEAQDAIKDIKTHRFRQNLGDAEVIKIQGPE